MNINETFKKLLIEEIRFVIERMEQSSNDIEKVYYFSAIPAVLQRIFNFDYDPDLVYAHFILNATHNTFVQRLNELRQGGRIFPPIQQQLDELFLLTKELGEKIETDRPIEDTLKKFVILIYSIGGNGFYLMQRGMLKI